MKQHPSYISPKELAQELGVHPATVARWIKAGTLPACRIARTIRIRREDVKTLLGEQVTAVS